MVRSHHLWFWLLLLLRDVAGLGGVPSVLWVLCWLGVQCSRRCLFSLQLSYAGIPHRTAGIRVAGYNTDTTPTQPHRNSNTHRTKNNTINAVIQQNSRKLLMMDILMSETCWAHKKWNKIASDIKLVFYSSAKLKYYEMMIYGLPSPIRKFSKSILDRV